MECAKCKENVEGGFLSHLYHIFRHYKFWGKDCIYEEGVERNE